MGKNSKIKNQLPFNKNDILEVEIVSLTSTGSGIARYEGVAIFVPNTAIGDVIKCLIVKTAKNYAFGKAVEIIKESSDRIESNCEISNQCGGCCFRHISYESELKAKEDRVRETIARIGGFENFKLNTIVGNFPEDRYRNKAQYPISTDANGNLIVGFYALNSHRVVACNDCKLQPNHFSKIANTFLQWATENNLTAYNETTRKGLLRHLYLRRAHQTGEIMVTIVVKGNGIKGLEENLVTTLTQSFPEIVSVVINSNHEDTNVVLGKKCRTIFGKDYITDSLCGLNFNISPLSFFQVNTKQAENLYSKAKEFATLKNDDILLDLYCGTGTIGLSMASEVKKLIGVEIIPQAIENAKINAQNNNIENAEFICGDAMEIAKTLVSRNEQASIVMLDPPRKGCEESLLKTIAHDIKPDRVVYISCDVATLARDMKILGELGYEAIEGVAVDMFSRTSHVETVVLMSRI